MAVQVISASRSEWIAPFTGLQPGQFRTLVRVVAERGGDAIADGRPGRQWRLDLTDRVLLVTATGEPQPGNRNDCTVYRDSGIADPLAGHPAMADGSYQGNLEVIISYRTPRDGSTLEDWQETPTPSTTVCVPAPNTPWPE